MNGWAKAAVVILFLVPFADAQSPAGGGMPRPASTTSFSAFDPTQVDLWMNDDQADRRRNQVENLSDSVSRLDIKAPGAARREYEKGVRSLLEKKFDIAIEVLTKSIQIYPSYVAAHNALGSAYLDGGHLEQAQKEFSQAVLLDDHLPYSYLNLGRAQLALKNYSSAEESMQKASALAPLDLHLLTALTYAELLNRDYEAAVATARKVHQGKHDGAAIVHYFAAAACQGQNNLPEAQKELQTFVKEDPKSSLVAAAQQTIQQINNRGNQPAPPVAITYSTVPSVDPEASGRMVLQRFKLQRELAEVEAEADCESCGAPTGSVSLAENPPVAVVTQPGPHAALADFPLLLHSSVNEVAVSFSAAENGKSVSDLTLQDVMIRDDGKPPLSVIDFRSESQLPLRLGLVIDTSSSITREFAFEQKAAASFLQETVTDQQDSAFVVGFSSAVLLVQDFTGDYAAISHGVEQLAPAGGTALWDAVKFASEKFGGTREPGPVARILVVISDGEDNSSTATLKEAIESAERNGVTIYTVSTRKMTGDTPGAMIADRAMKAMAARSGGTALFPDSMSGLEHHLAEIQRLIRSRYRISYKPADFETDNRYRSIAISAQKSGHKLRVYARRGYYARSYAGNESR